MRNWSAGVIAAFVGLLLGPPGAASAGVIVYSDRAAFLTNTRSTTNITFEQDQGPSGYALYPSPPGLTLNGVNFQGGPNSSLFVIDPSLSPIYEWGSGDVLSSQGGDDTIRVTLPPGVTAVGTDLFEYTFVRTPVIATLTDGRSFVVATFDRPDRAFIGFTSDVPIAGLTLRSSLAGNPNANPNGHDNNTNLDNFVFGQAIPEPTGLTALAVGGLAALGYGVVEAEGGAGGSRGVNGTSPTPARSSTGRPGAPARGDRRSATRSRPFCPSPPRFPGRSR